jgi:hypothetical protein
MSLLIVNEIRKDSMKRKNFFFFFFFSPVMALIPFINIYRRSIHLQYDYMTDRIFKKEMAGRDTSP